MSFKELLELESFKSFVFDDAFSREDGEQQFRSKRNALRAAIAAAHAAQREKVAKEFESYLASLSLPPTARYEDVIKNASGVKAVEALKEKGYDGMSGEALFKRFQRDKVEMYRNDASTLYRLSKEMHFSDKTPFAEFLDYVKKKLGKDRIIYDIPEDETEKGEVSDVTTGEDNAKKAEGIKSQEQSDNTASKETNDSNRKQEDERKKSQDRSDDRNRRGRGMKLSNIKCFFEENGKLYREKKEAKIKQSVENKKRFFELLDKKRDLFSNTSKIEELRFLREYPAYKSLGESERRILFEEYKKERNMIEDKQNLQQEFTDNAQEFLSSSSSESHSFSSSSSSSSSSHHSKRGRLSTSSSSEDFSVSSSASSSSKSDSESISSTSSGEYKEEKEGENEEDKKERKEKNVKEKEKEKPKKQENKEKKKEKKKHSHHHHKKHSKRKRSYSSSSSSSSDEKRSHKKKKH